jgi:hypothetical protein
MPLFHSALLNRLCNQYVVLPIGDDLLHKLLNLKQTIFLPSLAVAYMPTLLCKYFFDMDFYARDDEEQVILKKIDCKICKYLPG